MKLRSIVFSWIALSTLAFAADHLKLNSKLDYTSDSQDGSLITGEHIQDGAVAGRPNYVIIYGEGCFNSKRQARRTVDLYERYRGRVNFVVVDLDSPRNPAQQELVKKYYKGYIPHRVVLDKFGNAAYNSSGELEDSKIAEIFDRLLK